MIMMIMILIIKIIYSIENSKLLLPNIYEKNKNIIKYQIDLYNYF